MDKYTLIIPTNSLYILKEWDPELKIQALRGQGTIGTASEKISIKMGHIDLGFYRDATKREAALLYDFGNGEIPLKGIYESVYEKTGLPDINIEYMVYMERDLKLGPSLPKTVRCDFNRKTVHQGIFKRMVQNGKYPMQEIHEILNGIQESLKDLPEEVRKRYKPSCLNLETNPPIKDDGPAVYALKRPYMIFMRETTQNWTLFDLEHKKQVGGVLA